MKILKKSGWISFVIALVISAVSYPFLPDKIAIQWSFYGKVSNMVPKIAYAVGAPIIIFLINLIYKDNESKKVQVLIVSIVIIALSIMTVMLNLLFYK